MNEEATTFVIQRYLDVLQEGTDAEPLIRDLLDRSVRRLRLLCASLLQRSYPRLTRPPVNLETDELLDGVVGGLLTALRKIRPQTVRQFFALANQHMRWQLNDLARLLDNQPRAAPLAESGVAAPASSSDSILSHDARRMLQAIEGLPADEREVFDLVRIQGLAYAEAAEVIGVSVKTVQRRLNRARLLLAEQLAGGQVRIARAASGYWSYIGTDVLHIAPNQATMNLQGFTMSTPEAEYHRVVRHETGHTLGFPHEHMRQELVSLLDVEKTIAWFAKNVGWDRQTVIQQVLTPLEESGLIGTPHADAISIMCYQLPGYRA